MRRSENDQERAPWHNLGGIEENVCEQSLAVRLAEVSTVIFVELNGSGSTCFMQRLWTTGVDEKGERSGGLGRAVALFRGVSACCVRREVVDGGMMIPYRTE